MIGFYVYTQAFDKNFILPQVQWHSFWNGWVSQLKRLKAEVLYILPAPKTRQTTEHPAETNCRIKGAGARQSNRFVVPAEVESPHTYSLKDNQIWAQMHRDILQRLCWKRYFLWKLLHLLVFLNALKQVYIKRSVSGLWLWKRQFYIQIQRDKLSEYTIIKWFLQFDSKSCSHIKRFYISFTTECKSDASQQTFLNWRGQALQKAPSPLYTNQFPFRNDRRKIT